MSNQQSEPGVWALGTAYEPYIGRWSRLVAREFIGWLNIPAGSRWLDLGCGTGALSQTILDRAVPGAVLGIDGPADFINYAREHVQDERAKFIVRDAQELPSDVGDYHAVVAGLVLNFLPQPLQAVIGMKRAAGSEGVVAAYVWDYAGRMQLLRHFWNAAAALDPAAYDLDEGRRFPICQPDPLLELFRSAGLKEVEVRPIDIATNFRDFEDFWTPFLGGQGPAPGYAMSLSEEKRAALRDRILAGLPFALDGSIPLVARAWAVRGISDY